MSYLFLSLCVPYISLVPNAAHLKTTSFTLFIGKQNQNVTSFTPLFAQLYVNKLPWK